VGNCFNKVSSHANVSVFDVSISCNAADHSSVCTCVQCVDLLNCFTGNIVHLKESSAFGIITVWFS